MRERDFQPHGPGAVRIAQFSRLEGGSAIARILASRTADSEPDRTPARRA